MPKYKVIKELGRGGFGVVEEVENKKGERLARKTFQPAPHNLPHLPAEKKKVVDKLRKRFVREVDTQRELEGPEIITVLDADLEIDNPWFVMPLADKTYADQIREDLATGTITIEAVADILNSLEYLHGMGYVHRDLNPRNILLHDGHWKLTDFGAVLPPKGQTITLTEDTTIFTELYCSPEQRQEFHTVQPPSDVYSFGCILHDLVGGGATRTPYAQHSADGAIGMLIEKCTNKKPNKRPTIGTLRDLVLEALFDAGGHFKIDDAQSEEWINKLATIDDWNDKDFEDFLRFFKNLDGEARTEGFEDRWVGTLSTPFLTHLPATALGIIAKRQDGLSAAIIEEYCDWVRATSFAFGFADNVASRLGAIFDNGTNADKALAFAALVDLGSGHNRWYVMRMALRRCGRDITNELAKRLRIEIKMEKLTHSFRNCVNVVVWPRESLHGELESVLPKPK